MRRSNKVAHSHRRAVGFALAAALSMPVVARGCPMCKDGVVADPTAVAGSAAPVEEATFDVNTSIYVMLAAVGVTAAAVGRAMVKAVRG
jgi:hypothetical protein